ncbi:5-oxoprolinase subunit PxpA [Novosphingopyxis sp.]|uniref:5-oxoprolinase subunit PxpA n=1 Tax=Novosphingopyxis sp. TaxID=2709690 RepID=UPI003B5B7401
MTSSIDLNADLGEMPESQDRDIAILDVVSSCNIACGGHAGDAASMAVMLEAAKTRGVATGAHPSYPDRENFGRRSLAIDGQALADSLREQIEAFADAARAAGCAVHHVKPHGALYNDMADDPVLARLVARTSAEALPGTPLVGLAESAVDTAARNAGLPFIAEAFVDRAYTSTARLVPRSEKGAVISELSARAAQALALATGKPIRASDGSELHLSAATLCLHSDSDAALQSAAAIRAALEGAGLTIRTATPR